jgi:hypothetical protein
LCFGILSGHYFRASRLIHTAMGARRRRAARLRRILLRLAANLSGHCARAHGRDMIDCFRG